MFFIIHRQPLFHLLNILLNFSTNIYGLPITSPAINQTKDSVFNQMLNGENLIVHEERGVVFSRVGHYYEVDDIFGLTVTVPVSQYICPILPMDQVEKLRLCVDLNPPPRNRRPPPKNFLKDVLEDPIIIYQFCEKNWVF